MSSRPGDPVAKARWFGGDDWDHELDFSVGGREVSTGTMEGTVFTFEGRYQDIVPDERIVYSYEVLMGEARISVSLATVELTPGGEGTKLVFTEQGAFLDGLDDPSQRENGTGSLPTRWAGSSSDEFPAPFRFSDMELSDR